MESLGQLNPVHLAVYVVILLVGYGLGVSYVRIVKRCRGAVEAGGKLPVPFLVIYLIFNVASFCLIAAAAYALRLGGMTRGSPWFAGLVILPFVAARLQMLFRYKSFREDAQVIASAGRKA